MKKLYLIFIPFFLLSQSKGQQLQILGPSTATPGATVNLTIKYSNSSPAGTNEITAFQWKMTAPSGVTLQTPSVVGTAVTSGKQIVTNSLSNIYLLFSVTSSTQDLNNNVISPGDIAVIPLKMPTGSGALGTKNISLTEALGASPAAIPVGVPVTGSTFSINVVPSRFDVNADGLIDISDLYLVIDQARGLQACTTGDVNGDSKCDILDIAHENIEVIARR